MSQIPEAEGAEELVPKLKLDQEVKAHDQRNLYVVVAMSRRKYAHIWKMAGRDLADIQQDAARDLIGEIILEAMHHGCGSFTVILRSFLEVFQTEYLLFQRVRKDTTATKSVTAPGPICILEIDFVNRLDASTWKGHLKIARVVVQKFAREAIEELSEPAEQPFLDGDQKDEDAHGGNDSE